MLNYYYLKYEHFINNLCFFIDIPSPMDYKITKCEWVLKKRSSLLRMKFVKLSG